MNAQEKVLQFLIDQKGRPRRSDEIASACGIYDKTATKEIFHLRKQGINIADRFVDGKKYKVYWLSAEKVEISDWHQATHGCTNNVNGNTCNGWYRYQDDRCNKCGHLDENPRRDKKEVLSRVGFASYGWKWNSKQHKHIR